MRSHPSFLISFMSVGLLFLAACSGNPSSPTNTPTTTDSETVSQTTNDAPNATTTETTTANNGDHPSQGGQVIESGPYHLELVPVAETGGIHLDYFLQKGDTHEGISDAKVTAQIELPNGEQKTLEMPYDTAGKHYAVFLPETATGDYKIAILSDINGEKVNGRFTFTR